LKRGQARKQIVQDFTRKGEQKKQERAITARGRHICVFRLMSMQDRKKTLKKKKIV